jgi:hypothetical protein
MSDADDPPNVAIACQGGGSHTAFTAGVLQQLFDEFPSDSHLIGISGTSGGAACAAGVQDELHAVFDCQYGERCDLRARFSTLFQSLPPEHPQATQFSINQQNIAGVAKFVLQLQTIIEGANHT